MKSLAWTELLVRRLAVQVPVFVLTLWACKPAAETEAAIPAHLRTLNPPVWQVRESGGTSTIAVGTTDPSLLDANACADCHAGIAAEWRDSRHANAWTNSTFATEYNHRPQPWCRNCHIPLAAQQQQLATGGGQNSLLQQGVNCAACHVRAGKMVNNRASKNSPHATLVDATFGSSSFCADCHNFTFPRLSHDGVATSMTEFPMQATVSQFRAGPFAQAKDGCLTCHGSRYDHRFAGAHDEGILKHALSVETCRSGEQIVITVANTGAGHNVPTGDVHRHVNVRLWSPLAPEKLFEGFVGRRFEMVDTGGRKTVWDSTLKPSEKRTYSVGLASLLGDHGDQGLVLQLDYVYIIDEFAAGSRKPAEPLTAVMYSREFVPTDLPACN